MGNLRGRIPQAYYDGVDLVIRKTKLYYFAPADNARNLLDLFLQHMANTPTGDTRALLRNVTKENRCQLADIQNDQTKHWTRYLIYNKKRIWRRFPLGCEIHSEYWMRMELNVDYWPRIVMTCSGSPYYDRNIHKCRALFNSSMRWFFFPHVQQRDFDISFNLASVNDKLHSQFVGPKDPMPCHA